MSSTSPDMPRTPLCHSPAAAPDTRAGTESWSLKERFYPESRFGGYTDLDGTVLFRTRVNSLLHPDAVVVEIGCGRGQHAEDPIGLHR